MSRVGNPAGSVGPGAWLDRDERVALLGAHRALATLPAPAIGLVADALVEERYGPGAVVFAEGDLGDRLLVVVSGQAEVSRAGLAGEVPLAVLGAGELVGEQALLSAERRRTATLTALCPLVLLSLDAPAVEGLVVAYPRTRAALEAHAENLARTEFIRHVGPFMSLDDTDRRALAQRVTRREVGAGEMIVSEGEPGESCFMLRAGEAEVLVSNDQCRQRRVGLIGPGSLFGEMALLTDAPRCASVKALRGCELLEVHRADLAAVFERNAAVGHQVVQLFRLRERPDRAPGVIAFERRRPEGETITVLKNPERLSYHRLSERGRFVWERLDGSRTLKDLTLDVYNQFGQLAPSAIANILGGLARSGMTEIGEVSTSIGHLLSHPTRRQRTLAAARRRLEQQFWVKNVDPLVTRVYKRAIRHLFTGPGQAILAAVALAGLVAFVLLATGVHHTLSGPHKELLLLVIPGFIVAIFLHECGHAFAVKAFGRKVNRAGVGWYWFGPIAFVDTSDMWLGTRRERILVSLAGPYTDMILAGIACLVASAISNATVSALLWSFALPSYLTVLANLNPLLEYDGYYILSDILDRPNLRAEALAWVGSRFPPLLRDRRELKRHRVDFLYGIGSAVYVLAAAVAMIVLYRLILQGWIKTVLPASLAAALAWVFALIVSLLATSGLIADLRRPRPRPFDLA